MTSADQSKDGTILCLSGGGYRAMLFHLGALWRLNEAGWLPKIDRISSVSGGSITAGVLAVGWEELRFDPTGTAVNFEESIAEPIRRFGGRTVDVGAILGGVLGPGSVADRVSKSYRRHLFGRKTLQDLPDAPEFVICATNLQSGKLWRFSKSKMADYMVGRINDPTVEISVAVAASSAFPPVLSPLNLKLDPAAFDPDDRHATLKGPPYRTEAILADGGIYDNLGLEPARKFGTVLISDGGGRFDAHPSVPAFWPRQAIRVGMVVDSQVRALRKRHAVERFKREGSGVDGVFWGVHTDISHYGLVDPLPAPVERTRELAATKTRLKRVPDDLRHRLVNWGYSVCDAGMRRHVDSAIPRPTSVPYPDDPV